MIIGEDDFLNAQDAVSVAYKVEAWHGVNIYGIDYLKGESPALDNFLAFEYDSLLRFFEIWSFNLAKKGGIESVKTKLLDIVKFIGIRLRWLNPELDISFLTAAILQDNKDIESARRAALDIFRAADSFISKSNQGYLSSQRQDASIAHRILRCIDLSA